ncbi:MAG: hypothetical protein GC162_09195 [Planctomycetes bacterium]|nr:hypothetical protein [Planctomycetota bacterium]
MFSLVRRLSGVWVMVLMLCMAASASQAATIAQYTFPGDGLAPTTTGANVSVGNVNFTGSGASQNVIGIGVVAVNAAGGAGNAATAVSTNSFLQFTVTPDGGFALNLASLAFKSTVGSTGSGYVVRSSVDGFAATLSTSVVPTSFPTFTDFLIDLSGAAFQGLTTATTFRIYTFIGGGAGNPALAYDDLTLNGTVDAAGITAPEPASATMLGLLGLAVAARRRGATSR